MGYGLNCRFHPAKYSFQILYRYSIHSKRESPGLVAGAFFDSLTSLADWVELVCHVDLVCWHGFRVFGGLTRKTGCRNIEQRQKRRFGSGGGMGRSAFLRCAAHVKP